MNGNGNSFFTNGDDKHLDNENNSFINSDASQFKEEDAMLIEVREHVEAMVEGFLGKSLDSAHVDMPYDHMQYNELFAKYKERLMFALLDLTQTLYLSMQNKPSINSPTNAHVMLKELINAITEETHRLPNLREKQSSSKFGIHSNENSYAFNTYEELLATAIINQLVDTTQMRHSIESDDSTNMTDSQSEKSRKYSEHGIHSDMETENILSYDPSIIITSNGNTSINADERHLIIKDFINQRPAYVVQEQIEEITTTKSYSDAEEHTYKVDSVYPEINVKQNPLKVPFPEAGVDIVDIDVSDEELYDGKSVKRADTQTWEENWMFKNNKRLNKSDIIYGYYYLDMLHNPVSMLIPNPSYEISTDTDIDDLSDLSEHNSIGSLEFSSDDETVDENDCVYNESEKIDIVNETQQSLQLSRNNTKKIVGQKKQIRQKKEPIVEPILNVPEFLPIELRSVSKSKTDPQFVLKPGNASVQCGILIQFCCVAKGTKPLLFAWFKQNSLLLSDQNNIRIFQSGEQNILEIKKTDFDNSGTYSCVVYNTNGYEWCDFTLKVRESSILSNLMSKRTRKQISDSKHEKNSDLYKLNNSSHVKTIPIVVQRTWAQRVNELENNNNNPYLNAEDIEVMPAKRGKKENTNPKLEPILYDPSVKLGVVSEREQKKWESAVEWKNNPYTPEKLSTRLRDNSLSDGNEMDMSSPVIDKHEPEISHSLVLYSSQKDLSRYKKDYYIPDEYNKEETLRSYDENEYSNSKYVDMNYENNTNFEDNKSLLDTRKSSDSSVNSSLNSVNLNTIPKIDISNYESSSSSIECSLPSVRELVNKFSVNSTQNDETKAIQERNESTENLPKNISPRVSTLSQPNYKVVAGSLTGRSISREFREKLSHKPRPKNRVSINANIPVLPLVRQESENSSVSTNEGYVSDESNSSSVASNVENVTQTIERTNNTKTNGNKVSRSVLKRASYWEKRCEQGLISDNSVSEHFPPIDANLDN